MPKAAIWAAILLLALAALLAPQIDESLPENRFARQYAVWIRLREKTQPGTVNAGEMLAWRELKSRWRKLEKAVEQEYRAW